jgi:fatty-acid desaturase
MFNRRRWGLSNPMAQEYSQALNREIQRDNAQDMLVEQANRRQHRRFYLMEYVKLGGVFVAVALGGWLFLLILGAVTGR